MSKPQVTAQALDADKLQCKIVSPKGNTLTLTGSLQDIRPVANGPDFMATNSTLIDNSWAYAKFKYWTVALPTQEEQDSAHKQASAYRRNALWIAELVDDDGDIKRLAWCSACFEKVDHQQVARPIGQLDTYLCGNCGSPTAPCPGPLCRNMAVRPPRAFKLPQYCAEHRHDISGFEKATQMLNSLDEYSNLLKFDKPKLGRINKLVSLGALSLAVGLSGGVLLAPAIGGAIGTLIGGYTGAAATSYGLALLGGGAIAAGGLGMAGGTFVVASLGAALGGALGLTVTNAYVQEDKSFRIEKLRDGRGAAVVLCNGFLTQGKDSWSGWRPLVDNFHPDAPVYRVHWGAKELKQLGLVLGGNAANLLVNEAMKRAAARAAKIGARKLGPLGMVLTAADLIKNPWHVAKNRADKTGVILADILSRTKEDEFILMGHSLGARAVAVATQALGSKPNSPKVREAHLFGAAIGADGDWHTLNDGVEDSVFNYFSHEDNILKFFYTTAQLGQTPAGLGGFRNVLPNIKNVDVTSFIKGHSDYFTDSWPTRYKNYAAKEDVQAQSDS